MKRLWICGCFALLCGACDDKTADEPVWNGDNYVTAFSLTVGEATYEAVVHDGRITVDVPYDASLDGAEVHYELCEHASIHPDPATIRDWSQEWQFLVSSYGQSDRTYIYTVNRTDVATGGSLTLRTQAEVDAFAASRINVVEGNLTIGVEGGEAIVNLDGLAGLVSVRCDLTVTNAYRGEDLAGLAGLRRCESLRIGSAGAPNETLKRIELPALREVAGDLQLCGTAVRSVVFSALQRVDGAFAVGSDALVEIVADELESVGGDMRLAGSTGNAAKAPCEQMYFPELQRVGGELSVARFGKLGQLATTFGALASVGSIAYEELALTASCEFPLIETVGAVALTDCPALRTISLPRLAAAGSFSVEGCPAVETVDLPLVERFEGDVRLASLPAVTDFGALLPRLTAIGGDLTLDDLSGLAGVFDLSKYAFSEHSAVTLRFVSTPKLTELRGGGFAGSLSLDAAALAPQPETMPFALSGFERLDVLRVVGFKGLSALSLPVAACTDLLIENCGTQRAFALSLPALEEVRGTLLCKNCGKTGAANSASFPRLRSIGRQLAFYVNVSSFASLAFPELERVGDGLGVSDDASSDYAFYTMPSGCTGAFVLPKLKEVRGNMLLSTWNASTDRVAAFRFPALETVTGELFVGHASYKNRTVTALDFSALRQVGSVYVGNLSSATDFSTFAGALPSLSDATWRVENCGENPTYEQMLGGQNRKTMKHILTIILCAASCLCYGQERRQTESREGWWNDNPSFVVPIREIGVTARRPMKEIGVQKTRLDTLVLHENIALSMADVLTFNTSIFVKQYGRATLSTVAFRGTSPSHTQVTWNGMRINSPMLGMTDFSMIPSYFIDDASLLHGTSSVNETGGGLGGAVKLSTRPADRRGFGLQYVQGVGSFSTFDEFLRLTYGGDRWQSSTRVVYSSSPNDFRYRNYNKKLNVYDDDRNIVDSYYPVERNKSGAYHDLHLLQELYCNSGDGNRFGLQAWYVHSSRGVPMLSVDHKEDDDYSNVQREQTLRGILQWDHLRENWKVGAKAGYIHTWMAYDFEKSLGNGNMAQMIRSRSRIDTFFGQVEGEYSVGDKWLFTADLSVHQHLVESVDKNVLPMKDPQQLGGNRKKVQVGYDQGRVELSGYVSAKYQPTDRLGLSLALREEMFGDDWTPVIPAFFADYVLSHRGRVVAKASVSRNFRFPTLNDLYFLPGGNPDLKKEHGISYDGGVSFAVGRGGSYSLHGEATWFDSYIDDWIVWLPTFKGFWTPKNIKEVHAYGVELKAGFDWQPAPDWQLNADGNFSWTPSINNGDPVDWYDKAIGKQLVYIPEYSASVTGRLTYRSWRFIYKWCYYSERFTTSDNSMKTKIGRVKPYFMSDVSLEKAFSLRWADFTVKGVVNNLFNEEYESVLSRPMPRLNYELFLDIRPRWGRRR